MRYALLLLGLALAAPAGAQTAPPGAAADTGLSLSGALALAREHSPRLRAASGRSQAAAGAARERAAPGNPVVELRRENVGATFVEDRFALVTLPLDLTFRRASLRASGREAIAAAAADSVSAARELEAAVASAYWRCALADALAGSAATEAAAMDEIAAYERTRLREGAVAEGVVLRTGLESEKARLALARARAEAERRHAELAREIGLAPEAVPRARLGGAPAPAAEAALPAGTGVERALAARPEVEAASRRVEAARRGLTAEWRATLPDVGLQVGAVTRAGRTSGIVALSLPVPLLDRRGGARERARGELLLAEAELQAARDRVGAEATAALESYRHLLAARPVESAAMAARGEEIARIARAAYREGALTLVELLDAERAYADARATAATWAAELAIARIELNRALGAPIEEGP